MKRIATIVVPADAMLRSLTSVRLARIMAFALLSWSAIQIAGCKDGSSETAVVSAGEVAQTAKPATPSVSDTALVTASAVGLSGASDGQGPLFAACILVARGTVVSEGEDSPVTIEVTARLVEVPAGAIIKRDLYNYAAILKYEVLKVHRGQPHAGIIYVGHYNPFKPRDQAKDRWVPDIGGTARTFYAGQVHRMALETPLDDFYMGGIVNQYLGKETGPLYWAVWTNSVD